MSPRPSDAGKGDDLRAGANLPAYRDGYDRIDWGNEKKSAEAPGTEAYPPAEPSRVEQLAVHAQPFARLLYHRMFVHDPAGHFGPSRRFHVLDDAIRDYAEQFSLNVKAMYHDEFLMPVLDAVQARAWKAGLF